MSDILQKTEFLQISNTFIMSNHITKMQRTTSKSCLKHHDFSNKSFYYFAKLVIKGQSFERKKKTNRRIKNIMIFTIKVITFASKDLPKTLTFPSKQHDLAFLFKI